MSGQDHVSATDAQLGVSCSNVAGLHLGRLRLDPKKGPLVSARNIEQLTVTGVGRGASRSVGPLVQLDNVAGASIDGCVAEQVQLRGSANRDVVIGGSRPGVATAAATPPAPDRR